MKRKVVLLAIAACAASGCGSWSRRTALVAGPELPSAAGVATFRKAYDNGTLVELKVKNLAEPESLSPPGYAYIAWIQPSREARPQNLGPLVMGKGAVGELRAKTPLRDFQLFLTVEPASDAAAPSGPPLLWIHRADWSDYAQQAGP